MHRPNFPGTNFPSYRQPEQVAIENFSGTRKIDENFVVILENFQNDVVAKSIELESGRRRTNIETIQQSRTLSRVFISLTLHSPPELIVLEKVFASQQINIVVGRVSDMDLSGFGKAEKKRRKFA